MALASHGEAVVQMIAHPEHRYEALLQLAASARAHECLCISNENERVPGS